MYEENGRLSMYSPKGETAPIRRAAGLALFIAIPDLILNNEARIARSQS
jgi:hypothetical protein